MLSRDMLRLYDEHGDALVNTSSCSPKTREVLIETEEDFVLAPIAFWQLVLEVEVRESASTKNCLLPSDKT